MPKLKIGFIGTGRVCRAHHLPSWSKLPNAEVYAVCDIIPEVARAVAKEYNAGHVFTDYNEMLKLDEIDVVDICTPNNVHCPAAVASLNAGKHVFVEKPIGRTAVEAQAIVDAAKENRKKLSVGQCLRFDSGPQTLKGFADAGELGEVYYARTQCLRRRGVPTWGSFIDKEKQGGGPLIDLGVHIIDLTLWLMGHPKPVSASGVSYRKFGDREGVANTWGSWDPKDFTVEDFAAGLIKFDNGASLVVECSFAANLEKEILSLSLMGTEGGSEYALLSEHSPLKIFKEARGTLLDITPVELPQLDRFGLELGTFADAITNDTEPPVTGEQTLMVAKIMDAIYESAETGREVVIL